MKIQTFVVGCALALALLLFAQQRRPEGMEPTGYHSVVDLTHAMNSKAPAEGTQIDAPAHFARSLWTVDQIPPERLVAPLAVLDFTAKAKGNPDYQLSVEDIADWEQTHGQIPQAAVVVLATGWESRWNSSKDFLNADPKGVMHFPGYSVDAAKFLTEARGVLGLGIDTQRVDYGKSSDFPVRQYTLAHSVYHLEGVANLEHVPATGAMIIVAPMKVAGGTESAVRILALLH
jgi:kynurenine formamidase